MSHKLSFKVVLQFKFLIFVTNSVFEFDHNVSFWILSLEFLSYVELGAAPFVQQFSVFSARSSLGYGTLIQYEVYTRCAHAVYS